MPEPSAPTPTETNITVPGVYMFDSLHLVQFADYSEDAKRHTTLFLYFTVDNNDMF